MSFEQAEKISDGERLKLNNSLQIALAEKYYGFPPDNNQMIKWVEKFSARFRRIVSERPDVLIKFRENREEGLRLADELLSATVEQAVKQAKR